MVEIQETPIDVKNVIAAAESPDCGAVNVFIGTVRNYSRGKSIQRLEYEAYPEMAVKMIRRIIDESKQRWPVQRVSVVHRVGILPVGEVAVVVAVSTPHRQEGFQACQYIIDRLKEIVPIWKKEVATDGESWVTPNP
jgi:molybdopterin synthase catalytic subunit